MNLRIIPRRKRKSSVYDKFNKKHFQWKMDSRWVVKNLFKLLIVIWYIFISVHRVRLRRCPSGRQVIVSFTHSSIFHAKMSLIECIDSIKLCPCGELQKYLHCTVFCCTLYCCTLCPRSYGVFSNWSLEVVFVFRAWFFTFRFVSLHFVFPFFRSFVLLPFYAFTCLLVFYWINRYK